MTDLPCCPPGQDHAGQESTPFEGSPGVAAKSTESKALHAEILSVGRKLWEWQYVDGNGGNISARLGTRYLLCTPTMISKGDLETPDICLSDLGRKHPRR